MAVDCARIGKPAKEIFAGILGNSVVNRHAALPPQVLGKTVAPVAVVGAIAVSGRGHGVHTECCVSCIVCVALGVFGGVLCWVGLRLEMV